MAARKSAPQQPLKAARLVRVATIVIVGFLALYVAGLVEGNQRTSARWALSILPDVLGMAGPAAPRLTIGQEARLILTTAVSVNASSMRVALRVIAAYPERASSGKPVLCNATHDVWQHFGDLGKSGGANGLRAFATMITPPFPWRVCVSNYDSTWTSMTGPQSFRELGGLPRLPYVFFVNESKSFFIPPVETVSGDFVAVPIVSPWALHVPASSSLLGGDSVKLVPAGFPCTLEKTHNTQVRGRSVHREDYCGAHATDASGAWLTSMCAEEGSVTRGVARIGTSALNPFADVFSSFLLPPSGTLVAYFHLPAAGDYDVCFSSQLYRLRHRASNPAFPSNDDYDSTPVWTKLFRAGVDGCSVSGRSPLGRMCRPRTARFTVTAVSGEPTTWDADDTSPGTWGSIRFSGVGLSSAPAVGWDCTGCSNINYITTTGGDAFRLVHVSAFPAASSVPTSGDRAASGVQRLANGLLRTEATGAGAANAFGQERLIVRFGEVTVGTVGVEGGCWNRTSDNYGWRGATLSGATDTTGGDTDARGVTASGNLGGDPRASAAAFAADATAQQRVFGYVRFPVADQYVVCYRRVGHAGWRRLHRATGTPSTSVIAAAASALPYLAFQVSMSDSRRLTFPEVVVTASTAVFNTMPSTFYSASVPSMSVVSLVLKLVSATKSCDTDTGVVLVSNPGSPECRPEDCAYSEDCGLGRCYGSTDDTTFLRSAVAFRFQVPDTAAGISFRVCLRHNTNNWFQAMLLTTTAPPLLSFHASEATVGSQVTLQFVDGENKPFDTTVRGGDIAAIVMRNVSGATGPWCDLSWNPSSPQRYTRQRVPVRLGASCNGTFLEGVCAASATAPTDGAVVATVPYLLFNFRADAVLPRGVRSVAVMTLPSAVGATAFVVCYKSRGAGWFEVPNAADVPLNRPTLTTVSGISCSANPWTPAVAEAGTSVFFSGQLAALNISCTTSFSVASSSAKLVAGQCEDPAAGSTTVGARYAALTSSQVSGAAFVQVSTSTASAYMQLPFPAGVYKICFRDSQLVTKNWFEIGSVTVVDSGIRFVAPNSLATQQAATLRFVSSSAILNSAKGGDAAKVVSLTSSCALVGGVIVTPGGADVTISSTHVDADALPRGEVDLGPADEDRVVESALALTFPAASGESCYKVCYKRVGFPWVEVTAQNGSTSLCTYPSSVTTATVATALYTQPSSVSSTYSSPPTILAGVSTWWPYDLNNRLTADSSPSNFGDTSYLTVTGPSGGSGSFKLVVPVAGRGGSCLLAPYEGTATTTGSDGSVAISMPVVSGTYVACFQAAAPAGSGWIQLAFRNATGNAALFNPFVVADTSLSFALADQGASIVVYDDAILAQENAVVMSLASLSNRDVVYFGSATSVCGVGTSFRGGSHNILSNVAPLVSSLDSSEYSAQRWTASNVSMIPVASGSYKLCLFASRDARVNGSATRLAARRRNQWYQVPFAAAPSTATPLFVVGTLSGLQVTCPPFTLTNRWPAREVAEFSIGLVDADGLRFTPIPSTVRLNVTANFEFLNVDAACAASQAGLFGLPSSGAMQNALFSAHRYRLAARSVCPSSGCTIGFSAITTGVRPGGGTGAGSATVTSATTCQFNVVNAEVASLGLLSAPATCVPGKTFAIRVAAFDATGTLAFTARDATVAITASPSVPNFNWVIDGASSISGSNVVSVRIVGAQVELAVKAVAVPSVAWPVGRDFSVTLTFRHSANALAETSVVVVVKRPIATGLLIANVVAVSAADGQPVRSVQIPDWMPTGSHAANQFWTPTALASSVPSSPTAAPEGSYLVAGHPYRVTLLLVDADGEVLDDAFASTSVSVALSAALAGNAILVPDALSPSPTTVLLTSSMQRATHGVTFVLRNSKGCRIGDGSGAGCDVSFVISASGATGGVELRATLRSFVRSIATQLTVRCQAAVFGAHVACPSSSTVETGVSLAVSAVDQFGDVDEYYLGSLVPSLRLPSGARQTDIDQTFVTTVSRLAASQSSGASSGSLQLGVTSFARGTISWPDFTLSRPCPRGCEVVFSSDWGANNAVLSITLLPSTNFLTCELTTALRGLTTGEGGVPVVLPAVASNAPLSSALLYSDTELCFAVRATSNETSGPTHYENIWVYYSVSSIAGPGGAMRRVTALPTRQIPRMRPLTRSVTTFCFVVEGEDAATFSVNFAAQRFGTDSNGALHWSTKSSGRCSVSGFRIRGQKIPASLAVASVRASGTLTTVQTAPYALPSSTAWIWGQHSVASLSSGITARVTLAVVDHYGNRFAPSAGLVQALARSYVTVDDCLSPSASGAATAVTTNTCRVGPVSNVVNGTIAVTSRFAAEEGGIVQVSLTENPSTGFDAAIEFSLLIRQFCLHCTVSFSIRNTANGIVLRENVAGAFRATLAISLLLPDPGLVPRHIAFRLGRSPLRAGGAGSLASWVPYDAATTVVSAHDLTRTQFLVSQSCVASGQPNCAPAPELLLQPACDMRQAPSVIGFGQGDLEITVVASSASAPGTALVNGEPVCGGVAGGNCDAVGAAVNQVDILNSYMISFGIGTQRLSCVSSSAPCEGNATGTVSVAFTPSAASPLEAVMQLVNPSFQLPTVRVKLVGLYSPSSTVVGAAGGPLVVTGSSVNVSGISPLSSVHSFRWRPTARAAGLRVLRAASSVACVDPPRFARATSGYVSTSPLEHLGVSYAAADSVIIPAGVLFPISVDVVDVNGHRVAGANGELFVTKATSSTGCNNGGTLTIASGPSFSLASSSSLSSQLTSVPVLDGRATVWASFSQGCEQCFLDFVLSPTSLEVYDSVRMHRSRLTIRSEAIRVEATARAVGVAAIDRPGDVASEVTANTALFVSVRTFGALGNLAIESRAGGFVSVSNVVQPTANVVWVGNGGFLRAPAAGSAPPTTSALLTRTDVGQQISAESGTGRISFVFPRTCAACRVRVSWWLDGGSRPGGSFLMENRAGTFFKVTTPAVSRVIVGVPPPLVRRQTPFTLALWHVGADNAGVASNTLPELPVTEQPSLFAGDATNGDGGLFSAAMASAITFGATVSLSSPAAAATAKPAEAWVMQASAPCSGCHVGIGTTVRHAITVAAVAQGLRLESLEPTVLTVNSPAAFKLYAADAAGFVDVTIGGPSDCRLHYPFKCVVPEATLTVTASTDGVIAGGFFPAVNSFHAGGSDGAFSATVSSRVIDGRATANVTFSSPVRALRPIFAVQLSQLSSSFQVQRVPLIDVVAPRASLVNNLEIATLKAKYDHNTLLPLKVPIGVVSAFGTGGVKYIATSVQGSVAVTFSSECKIPSGLASSLFEGRPALLVPLSRGYAEATVTFVEATVASIPCRLTLTYQPPAASSGSTPSPVPCSVCAVTVDVDVTNPAPTGWRWGRPTVRDNAGKQEAAGPRFAAAGRRQFLEVEAFVVANGVQLPTLRCAGCTLNVLAACSGASVTPPTFPSTVPFGDNAPRAAFNISWPLATRNYACMLTVRLFAANGVTEIGSAWNRPVSVCVPTALRLLTNVSTHRTVDSRGRLFAGYPYEFTVAILDPHGDVCEGDSQDDATVVTVSLVGQQVSAVKVQVMNTNLEGTTTAALTAAATAAGTLPSTTSPTLVQNAPHVIGGRFKFVLIFTASVRAAGVPFVQLRFEAKSHVPVLALAVQTAPFATTIRATRLRLRPGSHFRTHYASNRVVSSQTSSPIVVQAVDDVPGSWVSFAPNAPNIARYSDEFGSNSAFEWVIDPATPGASHPLRFSQGMRSMLLSSGEATVSFNYTGPDGLFELYVQSKSGDLLPSTPTLVVFQAITSFGIGQVDGTLCTGVAPTLRCLPGFSGVQTEQLALVDADGATPSAPATTVIARRAEPFTIAIHTADAKGASVLGDQDTIVGVRLRKSYTSTASVDLVSAATGETGPFYATVADGKASFTLLFSGTTKGANGVDQSVTLEVFCPRLRSGDNPCLGLNLAALQTVPIVVRDIKGVDVEELLVRHSPTIRIPMFLTELAQFDEVTFGVALLRILLRPGSSWPAAANTTAALSFKTCEVDDTVFGGNEKLGVCTVEHRCTEARDSSCPRGIHKCRCPSLLAGSPGNTTGGSVVSRRVGLVAGEGSRRALLQSTQLKLVSEMTMNLRPSDVKVPEQIETMFRQVTTVVFDALRSEPAFAGFKVHVDAIGFPNLNNTAAPITPAPTTAPTAGPRTTQRPALAASAARIGFASQMDSRIVLLCAVIGGVFLHLA